MEALASPRSSTPESTPTSAPPRSRLPAIGWGALFALFCILILVVGLETALHFLGPAIDGPFQLYNSLRRIAVGQRGGVDFQFFHGLALPYLHYPLFRLLGGQFFDSEIARQLVSAVLYPTILVVFIKFFVRDWTRTLAWSASVMMLSIAFRMNAMLLPVNSLLGVRSACATVLPIVLCLRARRWIRVGGSGIVLGLALALGTEQGLAAALALIVATAVLAISTRTGRERWSYVADAAMMLGIAAATLLLVLAAIGGVSGMRGALRYNFKAIPGDQYWYFGAPPNRFLSSWRVIPEMLLAWIRIPITLCAGLCLVALTFVRMWRASDASRRRTDFALAVGALYGLVSCTSLLGTYANAYIQPLQRMLLLIGVVLLDGYIMRQESVRSRPAVLGVPRSLAMAAGLSLLAMSVLIPQTYAELAITLPHFVHDHLIEGEGPVYSGIWMQTVPRGQKFLDAHRDASNKPPVLWSTYAGLLEARNGLFQPSVDYIIHALGPDGRAKYLADFERVKPAIVQTVDPLYTQYESWIESTSWDFYSALLRNYDVAGSTPWSLFWVRAPRPAAPWPVVWSSRVDPGADSIALPRIPAPPGRASVALVEVELTYRARNPFRRVPIVGAMPRYLVSASSAIQRDPVTIDPYTTTTRFPLLVVGGTTPVLQWRAAGLLPGARLEVSNVRVSVVLTSDQNQVWLSHLLKEQLSGPATAL